MSRKNQTTQSGPVLGEDICVVKVPKTAKSFQIGKVFHVLPDFGKMWNSKKFKRLQIGGVKFTYQVIDKKTPPHETPEFSHLNPLRGRGFLKKPLPQSN